MSDLDRPLAERDLAPLLAQITKTSDDIAHIVSALSSQSAASMLTNALLLRELGRTGIVNIDALKAEAIERAHQFNQPAFRSEVVTAITSIFGDDPAIGVEPARFRVIDGGLSQPPKG